MEILVALFIFGQTYADTTWTMYGGTLENTHFQKMVGAMEAEPNVKWSYTTGGSVEFDGAAVADVDGDTEVIIGSDDYKIYCLNGTNGLVKWSYPTSNWICSAPAIADVDGDGNTEVVIGSCDHKMYCLDGSTGGVKWSYPTKGFIRSSAAIADIDVDGVMEVIFGSYDDTVYCLNGVTGVVEWSYATGDAVKSSPALADIDGDGIIEVVIGSNDRKVYCLNGATGIVKWSYITGHWVYSSAAIADVDGDGTIEVFVGSCDDKIYCLDGLLGTMKWNYTTRGDLYSSPALADVDEDGVIEIIVGSYDSTVYCLDGVTGGLKWSYDGNGRIHRGVSIADIDGDVSGECKLEVLIPNRDSNLLVCLNGEDGSILWTKQLATDVHDIIIADIDDDGCVELVVGTAGDDAIRALEDVGNHSDCKCDSFSSIEENNKRASQIGIEFKIMGKGIYLFTPNAVQVNINVYGISGKLKQTIYKGVLSKGGHTFMPNIKSSGIYFVTLQSRNFKQSLKLIQF